MTTTEVKRGKNTVLLKNITNKTDLFNTNNVEVLLADDSISLKKYMEYDNVSLFASPEVLFSLKKSHINFPIKFNKHIEDYSFLYNHFKFNSIHVSNWEIKISMDFFPKVILYYNSIFPKRINQVSYRVFIL